MLLVYKPEHLHINLKSRRERGLGATFDDAFSYVQLSICSFLRESVPTKNAISLTVLKNFAIHLGTTR